MKGVGTLAYIDKCTTRGPSSRRACFLTPGTRGNVMRYRFVGANSSLCIGQRKPTSFLAVVVSSIDTNYLLSR